MAQWGLVSPPPPQAWRASTEGTNLGPARDGLEEGRPGRDLGHQGPVLPPEFRPKQAWPLPPTWPGVPAPCELGLGGHLSPGGSG